MGISGFHSSTKHYLESTNITKYRKCRIGIDASAWLHRGAVPYALEIFQGTMPWTRVQGALPPWVEFPMRMIHMMRSHDIEPILVFDGCRSPAKAPTSEMRRDKKEKARQRALDSLERGSTGDASKHFQQALDVTHAMAGDLIGELKQRNISFIVAPYEADAQLAYLARKPVEAGGVHAVITEDSDMVAYGCPIILFKSQLDGSVEELNRSVLLGPVRPLIEKFEEKQQRLFGETQVASSLNTGSSQSSKGKKKNAYLSFEGWTDEQMTLVCVLAGCDFLPSLKGMGFKTAHGLVSKCRTVAKTLRYMRQELRWMKLMSDQYVSQVFKAVETFRHSLVFDPSTLECVHLTALPQELCDKNPQELEHLGPEMDQELSMKIAVGSINPETRAEYQHAAKPPAAVKPAKPARISAFGTLPRNPITSYVSQSNKKNMWTTMNASTCKNSDVQVLQGGLTQTDVRSMFGASQYSASRIEKTATGTMNTNSRSVLMEDAMNEPSSKDLDVPSQALVGPHSQLNSADMLEPSSKAFPSERNGGFSQKSMDRSEIPPSDDDLDVIIIGSTQPEVTSPFPGKDLQRFPLSSSKKDNLGTNYGETPEGSLNPKKRKPDIDTAKKPTSGARNGAKKKLDNAARGIPSIQNFLIRKKP